MGKRATDAADKLCLLGFENVTVYRCILGLYESGDAAVLPVLSHVLPAAAKSLAGNKEIDKGKKV